jgi:murein L,D-transpeptidase YafK
LKAWLVALIVLTSGCWQGCRESTDSAERSGPPVSPGDELVRDEWPGDESIGDLLRGDIWRSEIFRGDKRDSLRSSLEEKPLPVGAHIFIRIFKLERELELWARQGSRFELIRIYPICYFSGELGPKLREGDEQTPEGFYFVTPEQLNPNSRFHLSFNIGYPNRYDRAHGWTGAAIMVHGNCVSIGCFAMTDPIIEDLYQMAEAAFAGGQPFFRVHVFPFRMDSTNMALFAGSGWEEFWYNLKDGYDFFERERRPPNVIVTAKRYEFEE